MRAVADRDRTIRTEGNINLLAAMHDAGVQRYILQSSGFWYVPGAGLATEIAPFAVNASPGVSASARTCVELESTAFQTPAIQCVALRYGFFYGPGTWYTKAGDMGEQVRQRHVPVVGKGEGVSSFVHIEDAAVATMAALRCAPGAYNIVDDDPRYGCRFCSRVRSSRTASSHGATSANHVRRRFRLLRDPASRCVE
jgi:nucleoside-diphosphate-sugar epimerase